MKIKIENKFFNHFSDLTVAFSLDTFASVFSFKARFNPDNKEHQEIFKPLSYKKIEIFTNENRLLLTGNIVIHGLESSKAPKLISVSGYSKSGILEDVSIPLSVYPLEKNNQSLSEISKEFIKPFGINQVVDSTVQNDMNLVYEKAVAQPTDTVAGFLSSLAAQRNIIIGHTKKGDIYYFKSFTEQRPKRFFNASNVLLSKILINGRGLHSSISVLRQPSDSGGGVSTVDTVENKTVGQERNLIKVLSSGEETAVSQAADNVLASQLKSLKLKIELPKIDYDLKCGEIVEFQNKELFIYKRQRFIISEINYSENQKEDKMSLLLLLPEAFTGKPPKNIFEL